MKNPFQWALKSVRTKGIVRTIKIAASVIVDWYFDWTHGTDTVQFVSKEIFDINSHNLLHSANYRATKARPLLKLLRELNLPKDCAFVDVGAGKGRVLLIASRYGFSRTVGIEFSGKLCKIAQQNIDIFTRKAKDTSGSIEIIEADATSYEFSADEQVLFLFNPFDLVIMTIFVDNLRRSLERDPRKMWVIYSTPLHTEAITNSNLFKSNTLYEYGGIQFHVYQN